MSESESNTESVATSKTYGSSNSVKDWMYNHPWATRFVILEILIIVAAYGLAMMGGPVEQADNHAVPAIVAGIMVVYALLLAIAGGLAFTGYAGLKRYERGS